MLLKEFGEERIIRELTERFRVRHPRVLMGIGDDTSVTLQEGGKALLVTTDTLIEGTHFKRSYTPARLLGAKSISISLSDIASMGGAPLFLLVSIGLPPGLTKAFLDDLYEGIRGRAKEYGVALIGGNTARAKEISVTTTVIGESDPGLTVYRSGAKKGDIIWVTGTPGDSALGLRLLRKDGPGAVKGPFRKAVMRHLNPEPRMKAGRALAQKRLATSMIDVSDGVLMDLKRVIEASGAGAVVELPGFPVSTELRRYLRENRRARLEELALSGGEDYELLFTAAEKDTPRVKALSRALGLRMTPIGRIVEKKAGLRVTGPDGSEISVKKLGFEHFRER